jgi:hypothetical protein
MTKADGVIKQLDEYTIDDIEAVAMKLARLHTIALEKTISQNQ